MHSVDSIRTSQPALFRHPPENDQRRITMKMRFILLIKRPFESAARRILLNRLIDRDNPWKSRLLREDLDPILARAWGDFQKLWPEAPATQNFGNWHATAIAVYTLAIYRALRSANLSHDYAIELTSDLIWVFHIPWFPIINFVGFLSESPRVF